MKTIVLIIILLMVVVFTVLGQSSTGFVWDENNGLITITGYNSTDLDVVIPAEINGMPVVAIGNSAFYFNQLASPRSPNRSRNNQITSITFPNNVTSIGDSAFYGNQLTSVTIPDSVTSIGAHAFANNQLTSVTIPNNITSIETNTFNSNQLKSITIPDSITSIGGGAFGYNQLTSITIPNNVTSIGLAAFQSNLLTSITIGANVSLALSTITGNGPFGNGFEAAYINGGRQAGTYTLTGGTWVRAALTF